MSVFNNDGDTKRCSDCGGDDSTERHDCGSVNLTDKSCNNPCGAGPHNSAKCESLPSQIQNFTDQFFGAVVKTEVNGVVSWSLPCGLDIGLPANPRGVGEGLACYFLRLFNDGITGLKGDKGATGNNGNNGINSFTVSLQPFTQPTLASPYITLLTAYNPTFAVVGTYVFIAGSGWYNLTNSDGNGTLSLTLVQPLGGAAASIPAGSLIVPSGIPGPQGTKGDKGDKGDTVVGPPGPDPTSDNGQTSNRGSGSDFALQVIYNEVDFVAFKPNFLAPKAGTYLVTVMVGLQGEPGVNLTDVVSMKLVNKNTAADVNGSITDTTGYSNGQNAQIMISVLVTTDAADQTISLYGECTNGGKVNVLADYTVLTWVRIA